MPRFLCAMPNPLPSSATHNFQLITPHMFDWYLKSLVVLAQVSQGFSLCQIKSALAFKFVEFYHLIKYKINFRRKINSGLIQANSEMHWDLTMRPQTISWTADECALNPLLNLKLSFLLRRKTENTNWKGKQFRYSFPRQLTAFQSSRPWQCPCTLTVKGVSIYSHFGQLSNKTKWKISCNVMSRIIL